MKKLHILEEQKLNNFSENMAKIDVLFTKSLTFLICILNFPPLPLLGLSKKYTPMARAQLFSRAIHIQQNIKYAKWKESVMFHQRISDKHYLYTTFQESYQNVRSERNFKTKMLQNCQEILCQKVCWQSALCHTEGTRCQFGCHLISFNHYQLIFIKSQGTISINISSLTYFSGLLTPCGIQHPFLGSDQSSKVMLLVAAALHFHRSMSPLQI